MGGNGGMGGGKADSHDWDAIFAGLDEGSQVQTGSGQSPFEALETPRPGSSATPQGVQGAPGQVDGQQEGVQQQQKEGGNGAERPAQPGRMLTETGAHDDPIV